MLLAGSPTGSIAWGSNTVGETPEGQHQVFSGEGAIPPPFSSTGYLAGEGRRAAETVKVTTVAVAQPRKARKHLLRLTA
jgi:hypothetical protein